MNKDQTTHKDMERHAGVIPRKCIKFMSNYKNGRYYVDHWLCDKYGRESAELEAERLNEMWEGWIARGQYERVEVSKVEISEFAEMRKERDATRRELEKAMSILRSILYHDERGQGIGYSEAMKRARRLIVEGG